MQLAKVKGNIVSTHKNKFLSGYKLLLVHPVDLKGNFVGMNDLIAIDLIDSGVGDTVLVVQEGDAVQQILGTDNAPVNAQIIAIIDSIELENE